MSDHENCSPENGRTPWNKGKLIGARPPLRPKHVWAIRTRLLLEGRIRDLALFNLAIDSEASRLRCRGCQSRGRRPKRLYDGPCNGAAEEDGASSQV
jgi:hypothetical protein